MMSRTSIRLISIILAALFFASTTKEALGLDCPHHEFVGAVAATDLSAISDHAGLHAVDPDSAARSGSHFHLPGAKGVDHAADGHGDEADLCHCVGDCNGPVTTPPPAAAPVQLVDFVTCGEVLIPATDAEFNAPVPYLLPFANAPPLVL